MMILKNKLCGSASSARQGLSDPTSIYWNVTCAWRVSKKDVLVRKIKNSEVKLKE